MTTLDDKVLFQKLNIVVFLELDSYDPITIYILSQIYTTTK